MLHVRAARPMLVLLLTLLCASVACAPAVSHAASDVPREGDGRVLVAPLTGSVDPVMLEFTERVIERGETEEFDAIVFELDTPGGLSTSMDDIVGAIINTDLPVYVFVAPSGARAASAGDPLARPVEGEQARRHAVPRRRRVGCGDPPHRRHQPLLL